MRCYFLKIIENNISTYEYIDRKWKILRKNGEDHPSYASLDEYWKWFKDKIDYKREAIMLMVSSGENTFAIDTEINLLSIAEIDIKLIEDMCYSLDIDYSAFQCFPSFELSSLVSNQNKTITPKTHHPSGSIQSYYRNETSRHRQKK